MLIFVRHALSKGNVHHFSQRQQLAELSGEFNYTNYHESDPDITEAVGQRQAAEAGRFFKQWMQETGITPDKVVISPFLRTIHTASIFLKEAGYEGGVILDPLIREFATDCLSTRGTEKAMLLRIIEESEHLLSHWDVDYSELIDETWFNDAEENTEEQQTRAREVLEKYVENKDDNEIVLAFSHGGLGMELSSRPRIRNCEILKFEKEQEVESLFDPSLGIRHEPGVTMPRQP